MNNNKSNIALTGAAGFLGKSIIEELASAEEQGMLAINELLLLDIAEIDTELFTCAFPVRAVKADICDIESLKQCLVDCDIVIHAASMIDWGNYPTKMLFDINVHGTRNVIEACKANNIPRLIYTSTMDVLHDGHALVDGDESLPYPAHYNDSYAESKAEAEKLVIASNSDALSTSVIRPCGMYGPADPYHISESLNAIKNGTMKYRVGDGSAKFQHVYVGNVAFAHVELAKAMLTDQPEVNGEVYLITDDPAENFFDFLAPIISALGYAYPPKNKYISYRVMYSIAFCLEMACLLIKPFKNVVLPINRSSVRMLCEDFTFSTDKADREFGYKPKYSKEEAFEQTVTYFAKHME